MGKCAIKSCNSRSEFQFKGSAISFHRIPKDPTRREKWVKNIRLLRHEIDWIPANRTTICSKHFKTEDKISPKSNNGRTQLSNEAVPMVIDEYNLESQTEFPQGEKLESDDNYETDEEIREITESPRKHHMRKVINRLKLVCNRRRLKIKSISEKNKRLQSKNKKIQDIINELKQKRMLSEEEEMQLNLNKETTQIIEEFKKTSKKHRTCKIFPYALKKFALTLNFYSPAAYKYVRSALNNCLPHPKTLSNWYGKINGAPGFTAEAMDAIKFKGDNSQTKVICNLVIDEMAIRQQKMFNGVKHYGYVDYGLGDSQEEQHLASSALVLLLVCLNETWKIPIAYFLTHGLTSVRLANIINLALTKCAENNIDVVSVTCDGCQTNVAALRVLGCKLDDPKNLKTFFKHPTTENSVVVILDACHMLKLIRNCFESKKIFNNHNNAKVTWEYIQRLQEIQNKEGLRLGNKLTNRHIHFRNQVMKVKLASQVLSNSVAQSLILLKGLCLEFSNCEATAEFIKIHNDIFDILNSRGDPKAYGFKKTLKPSTKENIFRFIDEYKEYVINLTIENTIKRTIKRRGQEPIIEIKKNWKPVLECKIKTGFLSTLVCLESLKLLYSTLIETKRIKYLATYRLSQDHLELFFGLIRQKGGYNNNPNVQQFKSAYKKILNHLELKNSFRGNCIPLEKINILKQTNIKDHVELINQSSAHPNNNSDKEKAIESEKKWIEQQINENIFTNITHQVVGYISGYVANSVGTDLQCEICITALLATEFMWFHKLISIKDNGGLCYPSEHVFEICSKCEVIIRHATTISGSNSLLPKFSLVYLATKTLEKINGNNFLNQFAVHPDNFLSLQADHSLLLVNAIIHKYIKIRLYYESKLFTYNHKKESIRQLYTKLTLHSGV